MKRQFRRKIHKGSKEKGQRYFIKWPDIEGAVLYRAGFEYVRDHPIMPERQRLSFFPRPDSSLDVKAEIGPANTVFGWDDDQAWAQYGRMIHYSLPSLVEDVSSGLSETVMTKRRRLKATFQPLGPWRFDGPDPRSFTPLSTPPHRGYDPYAFRVSVSLLPDELRPFSIEELLGSYIEHPFFFAHPATSADVKLTYESRS